MIVEIGTGQVLVRVPAASANLGPGFDALGLALDLHDEVVARAIGERGVRIELAGEGAHTVPTDASHLVIWPMRAAFDRLGANLRASRCSASTGSRTAAAWGRPQRPSSPASARPRARRRRSSGVSDASVLQLAADLEGHPDNVAPCLLGGLCVAWSDEGGGIAAAGANRAGDPASCARAADPIRDPPCARSAAEPGAAPGRDAHGRPSGATDGSTRRSARRRERPARRDRGSIASALSRWTGSRTGRDCPSARARVVGMRVERRRSVDSGVLRKGIRAGVRLDPPDLPNAWPSGRGVVAADYRPWL